MKQTSANFRARSWLFGERSPSPQKSQQVDTLVILLRDSLRLRLEGAPLSEQLQAQSHADSYMRRLEVSGLCSGRELLEIVRNVRRGALGPETRSVCQEEDSDARVVAA